MGSESAWTRLAHAREMRARTAYNEPRTTIDGKIAEAEELALMGRARDVAQRFEDAASAHRAQNDLEGAVRALDRAAGELSSLAIDLRRLALAAQEPWSSAAEVYAESSELYIQAAADLFELALSFLP